MSIIQSFKTAITALLAHKGRSFLTTLGIIIGVASVIMLISLGAGLEKSITDQLANFGSDQIYIMPGDISQPGGPSTMINRLKFSDQDILNEVNGVKGAVPVIEQYINITYKNRNSKTVDLIGTKAVYNKLVKDKVVRGTFFSEFQEKNDDRVTVLGPTTAKDLFGKGNPIGKEVSIIGNNYKVIGILEEKGSILGADLDKRAYIPIDLHAKSAGIDNPTSFMIKVSENEDPKKVAPKIERAMRAVHNRDEFSVMTQEETMETVQNILGAVSAALGGIAAISLLVGGIGIMNIMLVSVTERTREIGLRKAVGARPRDILIQFLIEAIVLSLLGGITGIAIGFAGGQLIKYFVPSLTPEITIQTIVLASAFSALVGIIFGVAPAYRASKLNPIEALRYE